MKIAVISRGESDFSAILSKYADVKIFAPENAEGLENFDAYAILGGLSESPLSLPIDTRLIIEKARKEGKPVFAEWVDSIGYAYIDGKANSVSGRAVFLGDETDTLKRGDLLDDHDNSYIKFFGFEESATPILGYGGHIIKHDHTDEIPEIKKCDWMLWKYDDNTLVSSFRLCNYIKGRFAPKARWDGVAGIIVSHLVGKKVTVSTTPVVSTDNPALSAKETFSRGMKWFENAGIYINEGEGGVLEGFKHNILPDGEQPYADTVRNDCSGEVGAACFFDWYLNKNELSYKRFKNLQNFCFNKLFENEGPQRGLMRWSLTAWGTCYQDDVARVILGTLLSMELTEESEYFDKICLALDYMLKTTGTDGLRVSRTDAQFLTEEKIKELSGKPSDFPCAHHNGFYMATLLMAYKICKKQIYFDTALRGIETLMAAYPETIREHSETQELCRLMLPLACLYEITGDEKHKEYLYTVAERIENFKHKSGGYVEYDTGYRAARSRTSGTESSLLADNGDPICDLLYSANWLPLGFAYAFKVTGDDIFKKRWQSLIKFLSSVQMVSDAPSLNGCWCRGIDLDRKEPYGMPHDVGWGCCAVESGWTVAEILIGIAYGLVLNMEE